MSYAGPAPGFAGTDQINFQVPDDVSIPYGCYVALAVKVQDYSSNIGTLSTSRDGGPCKSPFGLSAAQLARLDAGESVYLGQVNMYDLVGHPPPLQWFDGTGFTRLESADASFLRLDAIDAAALTQPSLADDAAYNCSTERIIGAGWIDTSGALGAGDKLVLSSADKSLDVPLQDLQFPGLYRAELPAPPPVASPDAVPAPFFASGTWQVSAPGSAGIRPFTGQLSVPPPVRIANAADLAGIDSTLDLTIRWNGADFSDAYTATVQLAASRAVVCRAPANAGKLTIPANLLQGLSQTPNGTGIELLIASKPDRTTIVQVPLTGSETLPTLFRYFTSQSLPVTIAGDGKAASSFTRPGIASLRRRQNTSGFRPRPRA